MKQYGEILDQNVVVTWLENEGSRVHTKDTIIAEQINVVMDVQTQEKDANVLLDIGRKVVILIIGLVVYDAETQHH